MPGEQIAILRGYADRDGRPLSNLVRKILTEWLEARPRANGPDTHRRARPVIVPEKDIEA